MLAARQVSSSTATPPAGLSASMWDLPALAPPLGIESNFEHPKTRNREVIVINTIFPALMMLAVLMQFLVRRPAQSIMSSRWSEVMCILAAFATVSYSALVISGLSIGFGRHLWDIRAVTLTYDRLLRLNLISTTYIIAIFFAKLYVLLVYRSFFLIVRRTNILIWIGIAMNTISSLVYLALVIAQAKQCLGLTTLSNGFCRQTARISTSQAAINVFIDFFILFIPLQQVRHLKVSSKQRLGVAAVFGVGLLPCIMSVVKLGWAIRIYHEQDTLYLGVLISLTSSVELSMAIISPCLIFVPAFVKSSKAGISSMRTRLRTTRSPVISTGSLGYTSTRGKSERRSTLHKIPSMELVFLQEPIVSDDSPAPFQRAKDDCA